jgi:hypothetical protein
VSGGGVGLFGRGADGVGTTATSGNPGSGGVGKLYGGGGKGNTNSDGGLDGGSGAVRIVWGPSRSFPTTNVDVKTDIDMTTGLPI